jgi:transaldolase/glucose-6-phosphate isomerase
LRILDSTVPAQIKQIEAELDLSRTLFIVSSKSGGTTEPNILKDYFFAKVADKAGASQAGKQFIAITDPGSTLERRVKEQRFRRIFHGVPTIGGRYSVLSPFGLVPAAIAGLNVAHLVELSRTMIRSCGPDVPPSENPAVALGLTLGVAAGRGRDKITMLASPALASLAPGSSNYSRNPPANRAKA